MHAKCTLIKGLMFWKKDFLHIVSVNELNNLAVVVLQISQEQCLIFHVAVIQRLFMTVWTLYKNRLFSSWWCLKNFLAQASWAPAVLFLQYLFFLLLWCCCHTLCRMWTLHSDVEHVRSPRDFRICSEEGSCWFLLVMFIKIWTCPACHDNKFNSILYH